MKIPIITSAPIEYQIPGLDLYDSFDVVAKGISTASLSPNASEVVKNKHFNFDVTNIDYIYCARRGQTYETAMLLKDYRCRRGTTIVQTSLLDNIRFSLGDLMQKEQFNFMSSDRALAELRRKFLFCLYHNRLDENLDALSERFAGLISLINGSASQSLMIGHSFFVKLFEIYAKDKNALKSYEALQLAFDPTKKPYNFLDGFELELML